MFLVSLQFKFKWLSLSKDVFILYCSTISSHPGNILHKNLPKGVGDLIIFDLYLNKISNPSMDGG